VVQGTGLLGRLRRKRPDLSWGSPLFNAILLLALVLAGLAIARLPLTLAGALVLGGIVLLATLVRPEYGLYLLVLAVPFGGVREVTIAGFTVGAAEALIGLALAAWMARMVAAREIRIVRPPLLLPLLAFLGATLLSTTGALSLRWSLKEIVKWLEVLAIYLFVASALDRDKARVVVALALLAGIGQALLGVYQFLGRVGPEAFVLLGRFMRAHGTFEQPNPYGGYLGLVLPLAYGVLLGTRTFGIREFVDSWVHRESANPESTNLRVTNSLLAILGFVLMAAALAMSWSRGAWLGFAAAFAAMNLVHSRRTAALFVLACLLAVLLGGFQLLPRALVQRFADIAPYLGIFDVRGVKVTDENYALVERMAHWQAAWGMFNDRPWLGVGIGNYEPVYPAYALPGWGEPLGHAHNYYLNIAAEAGLVGLAAYLLLWGAAFWEAWRTVRVTEGYWRGVAVGIFGALVHLSVHNFFDNLYVHNMYVHVAILLGLLYVVGQQTATPRRNSGNLSPQRGQAPASKEVSPCQGCFAASEEMP